MVHLLLVYCNKHPKLWDESFHYVQHYYNQALHSSIRKYHFETWYGYLPKSPMDFGFGQEVKEDGHNDVDKANKFIQQIWRVHEVVQE